MNKFKCLLILISALYFNLTGCLGEVIKIGSVQGEWGVPKGLITKDSVCYSLGEKGDLSFIVGCVAMIGCEICVLDTDQEVVNKIKILKDKIIINKVNYVGLAKNYKLMPEDSEKISLLPVDVEEFHKDLLNPESSLRFGKFDLLKVERVSTEKLLAILNCTTPKVFCVKCPEKTDITLLTKSLLGKYSLVYEHGNDLTFVVLDEVERLQIKKIYLQKSVDVSQQDHSMQMFEYFIDLFKLNPADTEEKAYKTLCANPVLRKVNYLAVPWYMLMYSTDHKKPLPKLSDLPKIYLDGGFTVCQHIRYFNILPLLKRLGVDTLFTPHVDREFFGMRVLPFPLSATNGVGPAPSKDVWYSFVGNDTHPSRRVILDKLPRTYHEKNIIIKERKNWHYDRDLFIKDCNTAEQQEKDKLEYQDILARSRFSLCPRGTGVNSIRFWESLQAGAIPVLIADDMVLPKGIEWENCIIQVAENDVLSIPARLDKISPEEEAMMRKNCIKAYELFSGENFTSFIKYTYSF